ncbi:Phosphate-binding protein PstS 1 precursor [Clostridium liquoris]|jgi:phosphate transport system substrate-binding protein|uniref:Phosphate-binding protein n=1 Tax=Clostridium liquoris TaxID=1289519 RepID=A0A2T0B3Y0_9CLOT|nr:phosphate ABC transporter substrate-binding protein [Clostridium liquoris]PRR78594.1 Phosphate-binding protein PstS 1 precursor [Clostridium liquoris]
MKTKSLKAIIAALTITVFTGVLTGCGSTTEKSDENKPSSNTGTITAVGSTALQLLVQEAGKSYSTKNPGANISVQGGGSGTGINQVVEGAVQIGNSDVTAESKLGKDKAKELVDHKVCAIGFAIVTNKDVKVDSLTKAQIADIFTGKITNWKQVGGQDLAINVVNRPKSSGTRSTFIDTIMDGKTEKEGLGTTQDSSGSVEKTITSTEGSISYLALSYLTGEKKANLKLIKIDNVEATNENIIAKKYPFWSYEHMYTKGEPAGLTKSFIDYMISDENKALVEKLGYIPMSNLK